MSASFQSKPSGTSDRFQRERELELERRARERNFGVRTGDDENFLDERERERNLAEIRIADDNLLDLRERDRQLSNLHTRDAVDETLLERRERERQFDTVEYDDEKTIVTRTVTAPVEYVPVQQVESERLVAADAPAYVVHDRAPMSGWIVAFLVLIVLVGLGFTSLMDLSAQQSKTERQLFELRQELRDTQLSTPSAIRTPPPFTTPAQENTSILTQEEFVNKIQPSTPTDVTAPPTELPPPPTVVTPVPIPATPLAPAPKAEQPVPGVK